MTKSRMSKIPKTKIPNHNPNPNPERLGFYFPRIDIREFVIRNFDRNQFLSPFICLAVHIGKQNFLTRNATTSTKLVYHDVFNYSQYYFMKS